MPIKRIIICQLCGKEEDYDNPFREKWFIENISCTICSKKCFDNHVFKKEVNNGKKKRK